MTPANPLLSTAGMLCLALAAALLTGERARRLAAAGLLILGLALAAWQSGSLPSMGPTPPGRLGRGFLVGNGALLLVGSGLLCGGFFRARAEQLWTWAGLLGALGILLLAPVLIPFLRASGPLRSVAAALGLWLAGAAMVVGSRRIAASRLGRVAARLLAPPPLTPVLRSSPGVRPIILLLLLIAGTVATLVGSHVVAVFSGVLAATWAAWLAFLEPGVRRLPVAPILTLLLLPACWLLATIAGPVGLAIAALPQIPLSPAAELSLAPALLLAGWATAGLWPLERQLPGALLAPAGALLLARVAHPLVPDGLEYWRPLSVPLLVVGLWNAAAWCRWPVALAGFSLLGVAGGTPVPLAACAALLATALALELPSTVNLWPRVTTLVQVAAWPMAAWAGVRVLQEVLLGEVVYTALCVVALALVVAAGHGSGEEPVSPAR